ncbi:MAG: hypothetical protein AB2A00_42485, partial [Myxococcota bacterium]
MQWLLGVLVLAVVAGCGPSSQSSGRDAARTTPRDAGPPPPDAGPDEEGPRVELLSPTSHCLHGTVDFRFTATDERSPPVRVRVLFANGETEVTGGDGGPFVAQRNVDVLNEGFHNLQIQAVDRRNNLTEYVRTFGVARTRPLRSDAGLTCNVSLDGGVDTTAPVVSITSPTSGSAFAGETLAVAAQVTD